MKNQTPALNFDLALCACVCFVYVFYKTFMCLCAIFVIIFVVILWHTLPEFSMHAFHYSEAHAHVFCIACHMECVL